MKKGSKKEENKTVIKFWLNGWHYGILKKSGTKWLYITYKDAGTTKKRSLRQDQKGVDWFKIGENNEANNKN